MTNIYGTLKIIQDSKGTDYLAIDVSPEQCQKYHDFLIDKGLEEEVEAKMRRDNGHYHITIINVMQWGALKKKNLHEEILSNYANKQYTFESFGIGTAQKEDNQAYFLILENNTLQNMRDLFGLGNHDFHITLAFKNKDVFGVSKGKDSCIFCDSDIKKSNKIKLS